VEEVQVETHRHRVVRHIQHHVVPITDTLVLDDSHEDRHVPLTQIQERHFVSPEARAQFEAIATGFKDEVRQEKDRTVVDLGEKITVSTTHHIHHVIQVSLVEVSDRPTN
jgi:hypothetical protein